MSDQTLLHNTLPTCVHTHIEYLSTHVWVRWICPTDAGSGRLAIKKKIVVPVEDSQILLSLFSDLDLYLGSHPWPQIEIGGFQFYRQCIGGIALLHDGDR